MVHQAIHLQFMVQCPDILYLHMAILLQAMMLKVHPVVQAVHHRAIIVAIPLLMVQPAMRRHPAKDTLHQLAMEVLLATQFRAQHLLAILQLLNLSRTLLPNQVHLCQQGLPQAKAVSKERTEVTAVVVATAEVEAGNVSAVAVDHMTMSMKMRLSGGSIL